MFQLDSIIYVDQPDAREFCFFELSPSNPVGRADHPLGQEREPTLGLAEPGGVDWRIMDMGARSRREQVLDFRVLVGVAELYLVPYGMLGRSRYAGLYLNPPHHAVVFAATGSRKLGGGWRAPPQWCH